jgi:membrane-bound metal-dependent hydrolase YbcI (DUF457 family)
MCLGHTHALSGLVAGTAVGLYVTHLPGPQLMLFAGLTAGAAVLPDIDHPDSTMAHAFGFLTRAVAWLVGTISGGHRHLTHAVLGWAGLTVAAELAVEHRHRPLGAVALGLFLALIIAGALYALTVRGHGADVLAIAGTVAMMVTGTGLALVATAVGVGCATHVAGDLLTEEGCPLIFPVSRYRFRLLPWPLAFTTGTWPELWVLNPALAGGLGFLLYRAVMARVLRVGL